MPDTILGTREKAVNRKEKKEGKRKPKTKNLLPQRSFISY